MRQFLSLVLLLLCSAPCLAQLAPRDPRDGACAPGATKLLIVGTYHMANPGQDAVNLDADDPTSPRRQQELAQLLDRLALYQPTRVAVEATYGRSPWLARTRTGSRGTTSRARTRSNWWASRWPGEPA